MAEILGEAFTMYLQCKPVNSVNLFKSPVPRNKPVHVHAEVHMMMMGNIEIFITLHKTKEKEKTFSPNGNF